MTDRTEILSAKQKARRLILRRLRSQSNRFVGVGTNIKRDSINIYVRNKLSEAIKEAHDLINGTKIDGHELNFIEVGSVLALQSRTQYSRPLYGGDSIGHKLITAGTMGTVCYDSQTKEKRLLSNNHVLSNSTTIQNPSASIGDIIYAPGCYDTGGCVYPIGKLNKFIPLDEDADNFVDCAIAIPDNITDISDDIIGIGKLNGYTDAQEGMLVKKSGRTTAVTYGTITDTNATIEVDYNGKIITFDNCIITGNMAQGGDSGSILVDNNNNATGLLFAGSDSITVYNKITYVMDKLGILITTTDIPPNPEYLVLDSSLEYQVQSITSVIVGMGITTGVLSIIYNRTK